MRCVHAGVTNRVMEIMFGLLDQFGLLGGVFLELLWLLRGQCHKRRTQAKENNREVSGCCKPNTNTTDRHIPADTVCNSRPVCASFGYC